MIFFYLQSLARVLTAHVLLLTLQVAAQSKRGLPFNDPTLLGKFAVAGSQTSWCYNWYSATPENPHSMEFVPMLWCSTELDLIDAWKGNARTIVDSSPPHSAHLLSFEEPDNAGQCNISPEFAAATYEAWIQVFKGQAFLGAPAVSVQPGGLKWLSEFLAYCQNCQIDFVPIHWYGSALDIQGFQNYIAQAHTTAQNRPLWITEVS
jgi:hypothetical protein